MTRVFPNRNQFAAEIVYFSDCVLNDEKPEPSGLEGLSDVRIIEPIDSLMNLVWDSSGFAAELPVDLVNLIEQCLSHALGHFGLRVDEVMFLTFISSITV